MESKRLIAAGCGLILIAGSALLSGCASMGYNLGSMLPPEIKTVHVPLFVNDTDEPLIESEVTRAALQAFQLDGSLKVVSEDQADSLLKVVLTDYQIVPISYRRDRRTATDEYRIYITAKVQLSRTDTGEILAQSAYVRGESTFAFTGDLTTSKRQGLPAAAEDLAHDIVEKVVEYW